MARDPFGDPKVIGENIKRERKRRGLSQQELATMAQLHFTTVWKAENAKVDAAGSTLRKLAAVLDTTVEQLITPQY